MAGTAKKKTIKRSVANKPSPVKKNASKLNIEKQAKKNTASLKAKKPDTYDQPFAVVGIGGSAGGMEAFSVMLENLPPDLGMAYVYVQHLSSSHESFLPEILQRKTTIPVVKAANNSRIKKDHVYVIPANFSLRVHDGKFSLRKNLTGGTRNSINTFFTSLAENYHHNSIGVILSGTGSDGSLGLMAIKSEGGITFSQDDSAQYQDMSQSAVSMGYVDFVMPPDRIAAELESLIRHKHSVVTANEFFKEKHVEIKKIHGLLHNRKGVDFSYYKQTTINRRIMRRLALNRLKDLSSYVEMLMQNKAELDALYQDLLITVTDFFRDAVLYQALENKVLPAILKDRKPTEAIRVWIPGCATGEEAISIAIVIMEKLGQKIVNTPVQIFATDLNEKSIEKARSGIYTSAALQNMPAKTLKKYFVRTNDHYQVVKAIRDICIFAPHNLLKDPPFSRMDIISCQNVLIYLESEPQVKIMHSFHYALKPNRYLLLGKSETIGSATSLFHAASKQYKVYTKKQVETPLQFDFLKRSVSGYVGPSHVQKPEVSIPKEGEIDKEADKILLNRFVPASVLINKDLEILRFRGSTSAYLEPSSGKASLHLLKMVKEELAFELRSIIHRVKKESVAVRKEPIIFSKNGKQMEISIEAIPLRGKSKENYYLIIFQEHISQAEAYSGNGRSSKFHLSAEKRIKTLEQQLKEAHETIRIVTEDFEATKEELQSANEEVLSSNEELQSINEELETSKEELQSSNEELTTINDELQLRNLELKEAGDYARAIIETMHESLIMLDMDLNVRNANKGFYKTFRVTAEETEGVCIYDVGNQQWNIPELKRNLKLLQTKDIPFSEFEVTHAFPSIGKRTMWLNAHKFPLKDGNDTVILLAIRDLTERKQMEDFLKESEERMRLLIQNASDIITVFDKEGNIIYESPAIEAVLGYKPEERIGRNIHMDPIVHPDDSHIKVGLLKKSIQRPGENVSGEFRLRHKDGSYRTIEAIFRNMLGDHKVNGIIANYRDVSERRRLELQKDEFIAIASHELKTPVTSIKAYAQILQEIFVKANDSASAKLLGKLNTQVDRLTTLIVDLLDFTRIEGGKLVFREEEYELNALAIEVVEELQRTSKQHKIIMKLGPSVRLLGDRYRTGQVVVNLLQNAMKYSPAANKIVISSNVDKKNVIFCVQDFGIGIDEKLLDKIFERFFRVSDPALNTFPGLGLGLYVASEFIKRQSGRIWVKSSKGKGSTFCFSLPLKKGT